VRRFTDLRAWQVCTAYKRAIYRLCATGAVSGDSERRNQLERSVAGACVWNVLDMQSPAKSTTVNRRSGPDLIRASLRA
jgi:hypothetical protein